VIFNQGHSAAAVKGGEEAKPGNKISGGWTAKEHLMLLDAVERHGFGNWDDIAKALNTELLGGSGNNTNHPNYKSPHSVRDTFNSVYLHGAMGGKSLWKEEERGRAKDHTNPAMMSPVKQEGGGGSCSAHLTSHESILLGYLPIREDFEVEFDNEAESLVSHLQYQTHSQTAANAAAATTAAAAGGGGGTTMMPTVPQDEDEVLEQELKAALVEMYKSKLREREKRKKAVRDHALISQFFRENPITYDHRGHAMLSASKSKKSSSSGSGGGGSGGAGSSSGNHRDLTSSEIMEKLKILSGFQTVQEFQAFMANINKEKDVKTRIKDLNRFRKNGIRKLSETSEFEAQLKVRRINRKRNEKRKLQLQAAQAAAAAAAAAAQQQQQQQHSPNLDHHSNQASPMVSLLTSGSPLSIKSESDFSLSSSQVQSPAPATLNVAARIASPQQNNSSSPAAVAASSSSFSISSYPGYDILSTNEKKLCANLRLTPAHYISYKTCLLTNHLQKKKGLTPKPLNPVGLDKNNRKVIFNFLMRAGWITAY